VFYRFFRLMTAVTLRLFFKVEPPVDTLNQLARTGPVIFVGNHPNGLIDPGILFVLVRREVTFLAKAPLFSIPVLGSIMKAMGALPVYRKQDSGADMTKNEGSLDAAVKALVEQRAITLFPEGKSHSEPQLAELKTGCARIALEAVGQGAAVSIVPVGMTYEAKHLFRSRVHIEVGTPIEAQQFSSRDGEDSFPAAERLTAELESSLRQVTLNLETWNEKPLIEVAEALFAHSQGDAMGNAERLKVFARGLKLFREERPTHFENLSQRLKNFQQRLNFAQVSVSAVSGAYTAPMVFHFVVKTLIWLLLTPVFLLGLWSFVVPYYLPQLAVKLAKPSEDTESTVKVLCTMLVAPLWYALMVILGGFFFGWGGVLGAVILTPMLAFISWTFMERASELMEDARSFVRLQSRRSLKAKFEADARALSEEVSALADEFQARVSS
jgi:glycerol-3-phosphate O-acyltransferase / dihydroxyacetone phosphate acyltransferase